jgi:hypothetical protein
LFRASAAIFFHVSITADIRNDVHCLAAGSRDLIDKFSECFLIT